MKSYQTKKHSKSRRQLITTLGWSSLITLFGFGTYEENISTIDDEQYQTLLKPDGTVVKVKTTTIRNAKILKKNISNKSFSNWIDTIHNK